MVEKIKAPTGSAERRHVLRQKCRVKTLTIEHLTEGLLKAIVLDLSKDGFRLLLPRSIPSGDLVVIHPPDPPEGAALEKICATIVWQAARMHNNVRMIECGVRVESVEDWRRHTWFLALRAGTYEYALANSQSLAT